MVIVYINPDANLTGDMRPSVVRKMTIMGDVSYPRGSNIFNRSNSRKEKNCDEKEGKHQ